MPQVNFLNFERALFIFGEKLSSLIGAQSHTAIPDLDAPDTSLFYTWDEVKRPEAATANY